MELLSNIEAPPFARMRARGSLLLSLEGHAMQLSRSLLLALLAGLAVSSVIVGYFLNKRRRRYRAVTAGGGSSLQRSFTFQVESRPKDSGDEFDSRGALSQSRHLSSSESPLSRLATPCSGSGDEEDFVEAANLHQLREQYLQMSSPVPSDCSSDSFHSTLDELAPPLPPPTSHQLYQTGLQHAMQGQVIARTLRTKELGCSGDVDFLAKLYCVRLAFDELAAETANRQYFQQIGKEIMSNFLSASGYDPALFCERFDGLLSVLGEEDSRRQAEQELRERRVVAMNLYDVALDFVLLDAFSDLENPPSTVVAVLQNSWITDGMKKSALSAAVWSLLKAKRSMLSNKDGFMGHFYLLSEVITPVMAWGFLGTDLAMQQHCLQLKAVITGFLQEMFSLSSVRYSTVNCLADDILVLARATGENIF